MRSPTIKTVWQNIRIKHGLSKSEMNELLDMGENYYASLENNGSVPEPLVIKMYESIGINYEAHIIALMEGYVAKHIREYAMEQSQDQD